METGGSHTAHRHRAALAVTKYSGRGKHGSILSLLKIPRKFQSLRSRNTPRNNPMMGKKVKIGIVTAQAIKEISR